LIDAYLLKFYFIYYCEICKYCHMPQWSNW